jgi:membrane protein insertase Oxa1/YidC/SpoIIIJ
MTHEGAAWFANLTVPDPFYALGVIAAAATLGMIRSPAIAESMAQMQGDAGNIMKKVMYFSALVMIPLCAFTPSAVALLWTSNAVLQMGQALLLANPGVRLMLGLPTKQTPVTAPNFLNSFTAMMQPTKDAATAAAPPPGTKPGLVVNYLPHKPRVRKRRA